MLNAILLYFDGKHPLTRLIIRIEHLRLLHTGPTLVGASLANRYHITGARRVMTLPVALSSAVTWQANHAHSYSVNYLAIIQIQDMYSTR